MTGTQGLGPGFAAALAQARATGQPVPIPNPDGSASTLMALPNGSFGSIGGGFGGVARSGLPIPPIPPATVPAVAQPVAPSTPFSAGGVQGLPGSPSGAAVAPPVATSWLQRPSMLTNQPVGANTGLFTPTGQPVGATITAPSLPTITVFAHPQVQAPLNQANPAFTAGIPGAVGTQSGPPVHATYDMPPAPVVAAQARRYRQAHGLATPDDSAATDQLNAASLAAARAGRTFLQPGPYPATGNIVANALIAPPTTTAPQPAQQTAQNLLSQGVY